MMRADVHVPYLCDSYLPRHLSKSADAIRKEQAAALASLQKRIESAKVRSTPEWCLQAVTRTWGVLFQRAEGLDCSLSVQIIRSFESGIVPWVRYLRCLGGCAHLIYITGQLDAQQPRPMCSDKRMDGSRASHATPLQGAAWAEAYKKDLEALSAWDSAVSADPVNGPKISVSA